MLSILEIGATFWGILLLAFGKLPVWKLPKSSPILTFGYGRAVAETDE